MVEQELDKNMNLGAPKYQADVLPIELSGLD